MSESPPPSPRLFVGSTTYLFRYLCPLGIVGCVAFVPFGDAGQVVLAMALALLLVFLTFGAWRMRVEVSPDWIRIVYPFEEHTIARADLVRVDPNVGVWTTSFRSPGLLLRDGQRMRLAPLEPFPHAFRVHSRAATDLARELGVPEIPTRRSPRYAIALLFVVPVAIIVVVVLLQQL